MKKEFPYTKLQREWLDDLKTTTAPQASACLHDKFDNKDAFCCLGRACVIAGYEQVLEGELICYGNGVTLEDLSWKTLPPSLIEKYQLRDRYGTVAGEFVDSASPLSDYTCLTAMNDAGFSFKEIAEFIEAFPEAVFTNLEHKPAKLNIETQGVLA